MLYLHAPNVTRLPLPPFFFPRRHPAHCSVSGSVMAFWGPTWRQEEERGEGCPRWLSFLHRRFLSGCWWVESGGSPRNSLLWNITLIPPLTGFRIKGFMIKFCLHRLFTLGLPPPLSWQIAFYDPNHTSPYEGEVESFQRKNDLSPMKPRGKLDQLFGMWSRPKKKKPLQIISWSIGKRLPIVSISFR